MKKKREGSQLPLKITRIMKIMLMFILVGIMQASANTYAQEHRITLSIENGTFYDVVSQIEKQSEFMFFYKSEEIDNTQKINLNVKDKLISEVLNEIMKNSDLTYKVMGKHIVITKHLKKDQNGKTVTGIVLDENGEPIIGANVIIKGSTIGNITDLDGRFSIEAPINATLQISFIGYVTQDVQLKDRDNISITLIEDTHALDEVVVVGYGSVKRQNLTSSISKITDEAVKERPIMTVSEALQGQLAGVRSSASGGGVPGEEMTIRIRGTNTINGDSSPLYVIDGVPRENMSDINPTDIASIQVLKDASATSIYGSRGANGVILIETKQGTGKPTITFDAYYGVSTPEKKLDIMSGEEWIAWNIYRRNLNHLRDGGSMSDPMSVRQASNQIPESWYTTNEFTDWQEAVMHTAPIQNYQASASAKGDIGSIYFSAGYTNQEGIVKYSYYERLNARLNAS